MSTRQIAASTFWQIASQATMAALSILTVKFVANGLSRELAGSYNSAYGYLQLFGILADFGLYAVAIREVSAAKEEDKEVVLGTLMILRMSTLCVSLGAALLLAWWLPAWRGTPLPLGISIAALVPFFTQLAGIRRTPFQVAFRMRSVFIAEVSQRILTLTLIGAAIVWGVRDSQETSVYAYFLGSGALGAALLYLLTRVLSRGMLQPAYVRNRTLLKSLFLQAAPYGAAYVCMALYRQLDVTLIAVLRDDFAVQNAYYGFALRASEMAYLIPTFLLNSVLPLLASRSDAAAARLAGKTLMAIVLLGGTAALASLAWARPIMLLLTRPEYLSNTLHPGSDTALQLLALPMLLNGLVLYSFYVLLSRHQWKPLVFTLLGGVVVSVSANMVLIPWLGFVGAGIAAIITQAVLTLTLVPRGLRVVPAHITRTMWIRGTAYLVCLGALLHVSAPLLHTAPTAIVGLLALVGVSAGLIELFGIRRLLAGAS